MSADHIELFPESGTIGGHELEEHADIFGSHLGVDEGLQRHSDLSVESFGLGVEFLDKAELEETEVILTQSVESFDHGETLLVQLHSDILAELELACMPGMTSIRMPI